MKTFAYSYITRNQIIVSGIIEAKSRIDATEELLSEGIKILSLVEL